MQDRRSIDAAETRAAGVAGERTTPVDMVHPQLTTLLHPGGECDHDETGDRSFASDLNLDQVAEAMVEGWEEADRVRSLFYLQLHDPDAVRFRQDVFRDLERGMLFEPVKEIEEQLRRVRTHLVALRKMRTTPHRNGWQLDAISIYCSAVQALKGLLHNATLHSAGLTALRDYVDAYVASQAYGRLERETADQKASLGAIRYSVRIKGSRVDVSRYDQEDDYSAEVLETFERFKQGAVKEYRVAYRGWPGMNHVGEQVLDLVAKLFAEEFASLDAYCGRHREFYDNGIRCFERDVQFYLSYLAYIRPIQDAGLSLCYPEIDKRKEVQVSDTYDLALAHKLVGEGKPVVPNEIRLGGAERVLVVSGPNQGGKTTYARTFGQVHHLSSIGCPVPGSTARLALFDRLFTHFGREEDLANMAGKLEEDLVRVHDILCSATSDSVIVMNEAFSSTTLHDSLFLGRKTLEKIVQLGLLAVYVTFVDELASLSPSVVSMVSTIVPDNPAQRTFRVVRGPADGLAYALAIAEKYGVTYRRLRERVHS